MRELIEIATTRGIRAVEYRPLQPGLVITPWMDDARPGAGWSLTHVGSGWRLSSYGPLCWLCADALGPAAAGIDWTKPSDVLLGDPAVAGVVWRIDRAVEQCTGGCGDDLGSQR